MRCSATTSTTTRARSAKLHAAPVRAAHAERLPGRAGRAADGAARPRERARRPAAYLELAYGELKPALIAALRVHLAALDPLIDEPSPAAAHPAPAPPGAPRRRARAGEPPRTPLPDDLGALPLRLREVRRADGHAAARPARRATRSWRSPTDGDPYLTEALYVNGEENHVPTEPEEQTPLLPRADGRRAVRRRADGAQLARASRDAVGLPRRHGAPDAGTRSATPRSTTA